MKDSPVESLSIRDFQDADFASLVKLWASSGVASPKRGDSLDSIHATLAARGMILVMDERGGAGEKEDSEIIASVWLTDDGRRLYVHHMAVLPEWQGKGLGKRLMSVSVAIAAERGLQMKLEVARDNERALALYRRFGFEGLGDYEVMIRRRIG
ncbi:MAG TPA: GNAT family N-acetyltransferase [Rectinemataceae bacterium]|nr:GNAT family N-acetyltransferase [Rectinemataceae bacterium]